MGVLTDDMVRLRGEINGLRNARKWLPVELAQNAKARKAAVAAMGKEFRNAHAEMARTMREGVHAFVSSLKFEVSGMQAGFRNSHARMAKKAKTGRNVQRILPGRCVDSISLAGRSLSHRRYGMAG